MPVTQASEILLIFSWQIKNLLLEMQRVCWAVPSISSTFLYIFISIQPPVRTFAVEYPVLQSQSLTFKEYPQSPFHNFHIHISNISNTNFTFTIQTEPPGSCGCPNPLEKFRPHTSQEDQPKVKCGWHNKIRRHFWNVPFVKRTWIITYIWTKVFMPWPCFC